MNIRDAPRRRTHYSIEHKNPYKKYATAVAVVVLLVAGLFAYKQFFSANTPEQAADELRFDASVSQSEQDRIKRSITDQQKTYSGTVTASAKSSLAAEEGTQLLDAYVPVTNKYAVRQNLQIGESSASPVSVLADTEQTVKDSLSAVVGAEVSTLSSELNAINEDAVVLIPVRSVTPDMKVLSLNGKYYLDSLADGAIMRTVSFGGFGAGSLANLELGSLSKESVFTINQTGVTAFTRSMMPKLRQVGDPNYFSKDIGAFLAAADITHVSNEVSFQEGCQYHSIVFCSPPEFIETLKSSGVDVVELTGNHNNDVGRAHNTSSIEQYRQLGWATVGGGLNAADAAKPYIADKKQSKVAILAYNYPDSPNGGAIATESGAGANSFNFDSIQSDIASVRTQGATSVIVDVQFWECYAYPDGYVEYPICDQPIADQKETFRKIVDLGADMVVGTSAHQPQTFEFYNGKPIYYGLGNLYFEQTQWPGTERGIILTHYYHKGKLLQTKLTPTVYDKSYQTRVMNADETEYQLERLNEARQNAGL